MNLHIPLKPSTAGRQYAGWTPTAAAMTGLGSRTLAAQRIRVAPGVELNADVYTPRVEGRYPAVISFGAYTTEWLTAGIPSGSNEIGSPPVFTDRGYCPVVVERRGMGRSGGEAVPFFDEQDVDDHEKVIAWAADQPWCNGEVVLFGTSYYGMTQPQVAARRPPALRAFFANEICTDFYRQLVQFGGVPNLHFLSLWTGANFTQKQLDLRMSPTRRALISRLTNGPLHPLLEKALHHNVDRMFRSFMSATPVEQVRRVFSDWVFDSKTRESSSIAEGSTGVLDRIEVPFTVVQNLGYLNLHQYGSYDLFENAGTSADHRRMILAPAEYDLPVYAWEGEALAMFDHVLRGIDNGYDTLPRVRYWLDGAERFVASDSFPPRASLTRRLHLTSCGDDRATHALTDLPGRGANTWIGVPLGSPVVGGMDEIETQILTFELPLGEDTELSGRVTANLRFSCNEIDSYVVARLSRIDTDGGRHQLSMGVIRPAARTREPARDTAVEIVIDSGIRTPLTPGKPVVLTFSLTPAPTLLKPGESLRLDVASRTDLLRMSPADGYAQFDLPVPPYVCRNTLHFGEESWIEVDVVESVRR